MISHTFSGEVFALKANTAAQLHCKSFTSEGQVVTKLQVFAETNIQKCNANIYLVHNLQAELPFPVYVVAQPG